MPEYQDGICGIVSTINPHSYCIAKNDSIFKEALLKSDYLFPDGIGIVLASRVLKGQKNKRITGADIHRYFLEEAHQRELKVFYLGSNPETLEKIKERISNEYPNVKVGFFSPPYKQQFDLEDNRIIIASIKQFSPDILFVGMTAPKQEKWVYQNKNSLDAKVICSIGAVFGFYAGTTQRPGLFWQKIGMEWFPRLLREPKRLWRRTFISTPTFFWDVLKEKIKFNK